MRVFDFDKTIYQRDSTVAFYLFSSKNNFKQLRVLPKFIVAGLKYKMGRISKTEMKRVFFRFLAEIDDLDKLIERFWEDKALMTWYIKDIRESDVIISASPEFLVKPMMKKYGIEKVIASDVDRHTGEFYSPNCYGVEKVIRFKKSAYFGKIDEFYSDSLTDSPLAEMAKEAYLVKDGICKKWY